jgi:hypothetical protein
LVSIFGPLAFGFGVAVCVPDFGVGLGDGLGFGDAAEGDGDDVGEPVASGEAEASDGKATCATSVTTRETFCRKDAAAVAEAAALGAVVGAGDSSESVSAKPSSVGSGNERMSLVRYTAPSASRSRLADAALPGPAGCW